MPTLFIEGPYRVYFTSHDRGEPPHVHVERDGIRLKVWLKSVQITHNTGFNDKELVKIVRIIRSRQRECLEKWNEYFGKS
jgi:hypothetical protein